MGRRRLSTNKPRILPAPAVIRPESRAEKPTDPFYLTREWRQARAVAIALSRGRCAICGGPLGTERVFVDHIVEREDGGHPYLQSNLQAVHGRCHTAKTNEAKAARIRGNVNGKEG